MNLLGQLLLEHIQLIKSTNLMTHKYYIQYSKEIRKYGILIDFLLNFQ